MGGGAVPVTGDRRHAGARVRSPRRRFGALRASPYPSPGMAQVGLRWILRLSCCVLCGAGAVVNPSYAQPPPQVTVTAGTLAGTPDGDGGALFLGVPYAAPPLGELRWRAPRRPAPWNGVRQATREPPACPQSDFGWNASAARHQSENCLYLDIHTPSLAPKRLLPVLVWVHGGSNLAGAAAGVVDTDLVKRGIVVVAIQYRLGVFGFLSTPALSAEQDGHSGNYGLMDQLRALQWVHDNIARFGGDPGRVTIGGQSAGAMDVGLITLFHGGTHLFARTWAAGGVPTFGEPVRSLSESEAIGVRLESILGVGDDLARLRDIPERKLLAAAGELHNAPTFDACCYLWLQATVDGKVIPTSPEAALAHGIRDAVPYVLLTNRIELPVPGGTKSIIPRLRQAFGTRTADAERFYDVNGGVTATDARGYTYGTPAQRIGTDTSFRCPANYVLDGYTAHGARAWRAEASVEEAHQLSHHGAALPYLFRDLPLGRAGAKVTLQAYFANFIKDGNPNAPSLPVWPRHVASSGEYVEFAYGGVSIGQHLGGAICRLYDESRSK